RREAGLLHDEYYEAAFAGNPSAETLLHQLREVRPTGLISIPLRWMQIYERCMDAFGTVAGRARQQELFREVTGGRLRWGLSAAGYLEPRVFRFFHRHDVQVCSGFGMTEGTGGLTMTPPQDYVEDSVGLPLPGTRIRFSEAGELQIAGPYVARYLPEEATPGDLAVPDPDHDEHWIATGDLFRTIERGHLRIVDRIKDIYKNNKGQTIAPRKVEAAFAGVPGIVRTFLVGDGRAYNTLLIVPDRGDEILRGLSDEEEHEYFQRLITQANLDLAPYERVVNFAIVGRDFTAEDGEVTPKGSFRRKAIQENFRATIDGMYRRQVQELDWDGMTVVIPRWFYRDLGLLEGAIQADQAGLVEVGSWNRLPLARGAQGRLRVGDLEYAVAGDVLDLGAFVRQPLLWLGNPSLAAFGPCKVGWDAPFAGAGEQVRLPDRDEDEVWPLVAGAAAGTELHDVDALCQQALFGPEQSALEAVDRLARLLQDAGDRVGNLIRRRLEALANHPSAALRCRAYQVLVLDEPVPDYNRFLPAFVESARTFLCPESIRAIASASIEPRRLHAFRRRMHTYRVQLRWPADDTRRRVFDDLFRLLADFARFQPEYYGTVREELVSWVLHEQDPELARRAERHFHSLAAWFEAELRSRYPDHLDPQAWEGKIEFQEGLAAHEVDRMRRVLVGTTFLQESLLLAQDGESVEMAEIGPGGIWVSRIRSHHAYSRYRLSINTLAGKHYDIQAVIREDLDEDQVLMAIFWFIALRGYPHRSPVLPPFGCCRPELGALSLGYVSDLTVWEKIREFSSVRGPGTQLPTGAAWRRLLVTAMATVLRGWVASGGRIVPGLVGPTNVVVPEPDFREDSSLQSLVGWRPYEGPISLVRPLVKNFFRQTVSHYPWVQEHLRLSWIFDAVREALEPADARSFLHALRDALAREGLPEAGPAFATLLEEDLAQFDRRYLPPLAVERALDRFAEWERVNSQATRRAGLDILEELLRLYRLDRFGEIARFYLFRHTYFSNASLPVLDLLDRVVAKLHRDPRRRATELVELSDLQSLLTDEHDRTAFQRLAFPRSRRREDVQVMTVGDRDRQHVILRTHVTDRRGGAYAIHEPTGPAQVGEVYRLFLHSGYPKTISERDRFLVVSNDREQVVGGLCYQLAGQGVVHLDGIVVARALHDRGVTSAVLEDFATRMADAGHRIIKTHFFLRGFYLKRGFQIDRRWGGLVRFL
ncbi:MAG: AMP-binding protein, partial [Candidatus Krumholzibacteriia bacterium]